MSQKPYTKKEKEVVAAIKVAKVEKVEKVNADEVTITANLIEIDGQLFRKGDNVCLTEEEKKTYYGSFA